MQKVRKNSKLKRRLITILVSGIFFTIAILITLKVFNENIVFYLSPSELNTRITEFQDKEIRVGGLVVEGSIKYINDSETLEFRISDLKHEIPVRYRGIIPNLFAENQGSVALGKINEEGVFMAKEILAKHDENYMPREVAESLGIAIKTSL